MCACVFVCAPFSYLFLSFVEFLSPWQAGEVEGRGTSTPCSCQRAQATLQSDTHTYTDTQRCNESDILPTHILDHILTSTANADKLNAQNRERDIPRDTSFLTIPMGDMQKLFQRVQSHPLPPSSSPSNPATRRHLLVKSDLNI